MSPSSAPVNLPDANAEAPHGSGASLTAAEFQAWGAALAKIQNNKLIITAAYAAGIAAVLEIIHLLFLALKWFAYATQILK